MRAQKKNTPYKLQNIYIYTNTQLYILLGGIKSKENIQYTHFKIENIDTKT